MASFYDRHFSSIVFILTTTLTGLAFYISNIETKSSYINKLLTSHQRDIFITLATTYASLLGFTITAISLVIGLSDSPIFATLKKSISYQKMLNILHSTINWLSIGTIQSIFALFINESPKVIYYYFFIALWTLIYTAFLLNRTLWILMKMINIKAIRK